MEPILTIGIGAILRAISMPMLGMWDPRGGPQRQDRRSRHYASQGTHCGKLCKINICVAWPCGFSLLEIIVVVAILGILAAMPVMCFMTFTGDIVRWACYVKQGEIG